ncbi:alpha-amylase [Brachybacterium sp. Marseille-Q2903]|uniref:Alpha-amylase n=1 Tax=Brachybacterium epidermidis TaxID=2781983 RepID=A0ABR9W3N2_9MICO|nr:glycoside hydrolase family 13 protein [Brachybacterium epidermidis]MBE9405050.1 alpha-amylase [Brachybacterium epidermidis]
MSEHHSVEIPLSDADWWRQAAVYQIYPRSFADGTADGVGDLTGIISRIDYLRSLNVDAVWLSPFYPSALADGGYDVDDYRDVDPRIGTLEQFDELVDLLHGAGIRVIVDLVPNHSSDRHAWFQEALASPKGSNARERYIFRDGTGPDGSLPPADWESIFGGPAWTQVEDGQWYLHSFAREQPDFNWDHPEVREDFLHTLRFWSDRGVDGFRVDVAQGLAKELPEQLPTKAQLKEMPKDGTHPLWDRDDVHRIYAEWRRVFNEYDPPRMAVAEAWVDTPERRAKYATPDGLGQAFNFDLLEADFTAADFREVIDFSLEQVEKTGSTTTWVLSNHDQIRHATRYGLPPRNGSPDKHGADWVIAGGPEEQLDRELGIRRARAATMLELALPGSAYLYQGEELGLHEVADIPDEHRQDPAFWRTTPESRSFDGLGRDGCRVPIPWTRGGSSFGFGEDGAHLPQPGWFAEHAVEALDGVAGSTLELYREVLGLRRKLQGAEELRWDESLCGPDVLAFDRPGGWLSVTNFGEAPVPLPVGEVLASSMPLVGDEIPGATTVWLRRSVRSS